MDFMRIFKYDLGYGITNSIKLAPGWKVLSVKEQHGHVVMYILVDTITAPSETLEVFIFPTGVCINSERLSNLTFVDTVSEQDGNFMWHVFYKGADRG